MENKIWKTASACIETIKANFPVFCLFVCLFVCFSIRRCRTSNRSLVEQSQGFAPVSDFEVPLGVLVTERDVP